MYSWINEVTQQPEMGNLDQAFAYAEMLWDIAGIKLTILHNGSDYVDYHFDHSGIVAI